jgi:hypothetical protein
MEGMYFGLPLKDYLAAPGLSHSGTLDLAVSPLQYWHKHVNPRREPGWPTPAMRLGSAIHCRVLEPGQYLGRYARALLKADYDGRVILDTVDEIKKFAAREGVSLKGCKVKADFVRRLFDAVCLWPEDRLGEVPLIWDRVEELHAANSEGKEILKAQDHDSVEGAARTLLAEPEAAAILQDGHAEVSLFVKEPASGVLLKARLDCVAPYHTADLKSFSLPRKGKAVRDAQCAAMYFERYFSQAVWYSDVRELARARLKAGNLPVYGKVDGWWLEKFAQAVRHCFYFLFVESAPPHHLGGFRIERPEKNGPTPDYWDDARAHHAHAIETFREWTDRCGEKPWRDRLHAERLLDCDMPWLQYDLKELPWQPAGASEEMEPAEL